jgi:hypothetical protein
MKARLVKFGEVEVEGKRYTHDVVIDGGKVGPNLVCVQDSALCSCVSITAPDSAPLRFYEVA